MIDFSGTVTANVMVYDQLPMDFIALCDADRTRMPTDVEDLTLSMVDAQLIAHGLFKLTTNLAHVRARVRDVILENFRGMLMGANVAGTEFEEPFDLCLPGRFALPTKRYVYVAACVCAQMWCSVLSLETQKDASLAS